MTSNPARRWFQEPLVWLVVSFPLAAVVGGFWTLWLAVRSADGLVVDDYYRQGLAINRELARDDRSRALGLSAQVGLTSTRLDLQLRATDAARLPAQLLVQLIHPTRQGLDRRLLLTATAPGTYGSALTPPLAPGAWHLVLEQADWRLAERLTVR